MKFLEKDLETLIWENYQACASRGLRINQEFFGQGLRFRQMQLGRAGVADLVYVNHDPSTGECRIQVIECKREKINEATYLQAKRYARAIEGLIINSCQFTSRLKVETSVVLVGDGLDCSGQLGPAITLDNSCSIYTYKYTLNGVQFESRSTDWYMQYWEDYSERVAVQGDIINCFLNEQWHHWDEVFEASNKPEHPLVITADGVLLNTDLLARDSYGPAY